jgi:hypothetical protein
MKLGCRKRVVFGDLRSLCLIRERERKAIPGKGDRSQGAYLEWYCERKERWRIEDSID